MEIINDDIGLDINEVMDYFNNMFKEKYLGFKLKYNKEPNKLYIGNVFFQKYIDSMFKFSNKEHENMNVNIKFNLLSTFGVDTITIVNEELVRYEYKEVVGSND